MIQFLILQELFNSIALFYKISTFSFALFSKVRLKMCTVFVLQSHYFVLKTISNQKINVKLFAQKT